MMKTSEKRASAHEISQMPPPPLCATSRDTAPEIYRVFLTFGIVFLHSITFGVTDKNIYLWRIFHASVDGFVFISGWYGLTFRPSKIVRLYALQIFCSAIILAIGLYAGYYSLYPNRENLKLLQNLFIGAWFLNGYLVLMLLAPLVDAAIKWVPKKHLLATLLPPLLITFGWAFIRELPYFSSVLPKSPGVESYSGITLFGIYIFARLWRCYQWEKWLTRRRLFFAILISLIFSTLDFKNYASPFSALLAGCMFIVFQRTHFPQWIGRVALWLAPSMFAIFLFHRPRFCLDFFKPLEQFVMENWGFSRLAAYLAVAIVIFLGALLLDLPRRALVRYAKPFYQPLLKWIDQRYERLVYPNTGAGSTPEPHRK